MQDTVSTSGRPEARALPIGRPRWKGPLSAPELETARMLGLDLAYDPAQSGWVLAGAPDATDDPDLPAMRPAEAPAFVLRPWQAADLAAYHALLDDPGLWHFMVEDMPQPFTRDIAAALIAISGEGSHHRVAAIEVAGAPAGQVRLLWSGPDLSETEAEVSYWLGSGHRGRGLAGAAVQQVVAEAFAERPALAQVVAFVHPDNAASARLLQRAGFRRDGARAADGWHRFTRNRG